MNIDNLNKLIAHLEAQPPERINMYWVEVRPHGECGTCGCIAGHILLIFGGSRNGPVSNMGWHLGIGYDDANALAQPDGFLGEEWGSIRYPAHRVIATLKRLRDTYLSTGQVVVDWGPEPSEEPKQVWAAPRVAEVINPALPAELTSLLRNTVEA